MILPLRANFIVKNQTQGHSLCTIEIPNLPGSSLCPSTVVKEYLEVTKKSQEPGFFLHPKVEQEPECRPDILLLGKSHQLGSPGCNSKVT